MASDGGLTGCFRASMADTRSGLWSWASLLYSFSGRNHSKATFIRLFPETVTVAAFLDFHEKAMDPNV